MAHLQFDSLLRSAWIALCVLAIAMPQFASAQAVVKPEQALTLYRAFYFAGDNSLLHVEVVRDVAGRLIQPLPAGFQLANPLPDTPPAPTPAGASAMLVSPSASYVVYFGPDPATIPLQGAQKVPSVPLAFERLTSSNMSRPIQCAVKGGDVCRFPMMCHCGAVGGCCCY